MAGLSKIIFSEGKEIAMNSLFTTKDSESFSSFPYVAVGYSNEGGSFKDFQTPGTGEEANGFVEIPASDTTYTERLELRYYKTEEDKDTGKVTVLFSADLDYKQIETTTPINQIAIVNTSVPNDPNTKFYSATSFPTFNKNNQNAMTFIVGFRF